MHPPEVRERARTFLRTGQTIAEVARELGLPYNTVWHWCRDRSASPVTGTAARCFRCRGSAPEDPTAYGYPLGLYLGDGHLVTSARVPVLRIYCDRGWPGLVDACDATMLAVLAGSVQRIRQKQGCVSVQSYGRHWPCLLPQHGAGRKHDRPIVLTEMNRADSLSVARRTAVAILDQHVGPKS